jgi:hypothetical protein
MLYVCAALATPGTRTHWVTYMYRFSERSV